MSEILQKLLQAGTGPSPETKWPKCIADALEYMPEHKKPMVESSKVVSSESDERRNIRVLTRVSSS